MLAAYLDNRLDATLRGPIEDHVSRCEECYFVVTETAVLKGEETGAEAVSAQTMAPAATSESSAANGALPAPVVVPFPRAAEAGPAPVVEQKPAPAMDPASVPSPVVRKSASFFRRYVLPMAAMLVVGIGGV